MMQKFSQKLINSLLISLPLLLLLQYLFRFSSTDFNVPMSFDGDAFHGLAAIKMMLEDGWVFRGSQLGAPFGFNTLDFPGADGFFYILFKLLTLISKDPFFVFNTFYVCGFVLIYYSTYWGCRKFGVNKCLSIAIAIIFTIAPYHFLRNSKHLFLATYFIVPLITTVIIDLTYGLSKEGFSPPIKINKLYFLILALSGMCGIYYAFFSLILFFILSISSYIDQKRIVVLKNTAIGCTIIIISVLINLLPSLIYRYSDGTNSMVAQRSFIESEIYGLKLIQLILPIWGHTSQGFAALNHRYQDAIFITEATSSALGLLGSVGFLILLFYSLLGLSLASEARLRVLARLNIFAFLFATVGGLGAAFAFFVMPDFRGLNRISIFISFFSLLAVAILLQHYLSHFFCKNRYKNYVFFVASFLLIIFAIFDQIPRGVIGQNPDVAKSFYAERNFFRNIENSLPKNAMVFQYPYVQYPEVPPLYKEGYNEYFKPYLQTINLRWSYGAVKGRTGDVWNRAVTKMSPRELLGAISKSGFTGILVNTLACKDGCRQMLEQIAKVSGSNPLISPDGTFIFYKLAADGADLIEPSYGYGPGAGFYGIESDVTKKEWIWAGNSGVLYLYNFLPQQKDVSVDASIVVLNSDLLQVSFNGAAFESLSFNRGKEKEIQLLLKLNPGKNAIHFNTNAPTVSIPPDSRRFGFRVSSVKISSAN